MERKMLQSHQVEELITLISVMDRESLARQFTEYRATFPIDLTPQFLESTPLERLRLVFLALCLQCQQMPEVEEEELDIVAETAS
jgi:hypothetical protein